MVKPDKQSINILSYDGNLCTLSNIWLKSLILSILTLGIYTFWGKSKERRYLFSHTALLSERFVYTGNGKDLFKGFIKALAILLPLAIVFIGIELGIRNSWLEVPFSIIFVLILYYLVGVAVYSTLRYRISNTEWRGTRATLSGSAIRYAWLSFKGSFFNMISLGLLTPRSDHNKLDFLINQLYFGDTKAEFKANPTELNSINTKTLLMFIPTLGLSRLWYQVALTQYIFKHTTCGNIQFNTTQTGQDLFQLIVPNFLIMLFTLGLGTPYVIQRKILFYTKHIQIIGDLQSSEILKTLGKSPRSVQENEKIVDVDVSLI